MKKKALKKKIGLALGGGSARGLAHIGVLEVLEREGITVDMIAGTSAGAAIGALYAQGKDAGIIKKVALEMSFRQRLSLVDLALPKTGFIEGKKIKDLIKLVIGGDLNFSDLKIPFACVAADINTGEEVVISKGSVLEGIRASISLPAIFTLVKREDRYLVDGGLVNPVPVNVVKAMGADFIIAVNVIPEVSERLKPQKTTTQKEPSIFGVIMLTTYVSSYQLAKSSLKGADFIIQPRVAHIGPGEFRRAQECILEGKLETQRVIPDLKKKLERLAS